MAKKNKVEEPVYVKAPLKISKDRFMELLSKQIVQGEELLKIEVKALPQRGMSMDLLFGYQNQSKVEYDEESKASFMSAYKMWNDYNLEIYQSSFEVPNNTYWQQYESQIYDHFYSHDIVSDFKKQIQRQITQMQSDINKIELIECTVVGKNDTKKDELKEDKTVLSNDIFIVHGHSEEMKQAVARVVTKLGLNPIILHEQPNGGKTIIAKFEANANKTGFAIILLSDDDRAISVKDLQQIEDEDLRSKLEKRARQNVVFEMGYFAGKIGLSNMFYLLQEGVEKPGDLDGLVYTAYDSKGAWRLELVKELKNAGYKVSADDLL